MDDYLTQIEAALRCKLYYLAFTASLALPDICGALQAADGRASGQRYIDWFDQWVGPAYPVFFDGAECYVLRCAYLHQGRGSHANSQYKRVIFIEPGASGIYAHLNVLNDALNLDLPTFCQDVINGARNWLAASTENELVQTNLTNMLRRHGGGIPPYIVGVPVIG